jgi:hypothetical protein
VLGPPAEEIDILDSAGNDGYNLPDNMYGMDGGGLGTADGQVTAGAMPEIPSPPTINISSMNAQGTGNDTRVKIRVPPAYLTGFTSGLNRELQNLGGIIFPFTPSINQEYKADYSGQAPTHTNFTQNFYKSSSVSAISITGKFSVQNDKDAGVYLATVHLLRALTKMRWGNDADSGSPPPICRLDAWGDFMFKNIPVAINSFRLDLPNTVDYFTIGKKNATIYGTTTVPTLSEISVVCLPMYSRQEILDYTVSDWLGGNTGGYL